MSEHDLDLNIAEEPQKAPFSSDVYMFGQPNINIFDGELRTASITLQDLKQLAQPKSLHVSVADMKARHHAIAQRLAVGMKPAEIMKELGVGQSTISILQNSPAFKEILSGYIKEAQERTLEIGMQLQIATGKMLQDLMSKVEKGEIKDPLIILDIFKSFADRAGYGPVQKVLQGNISMTMEDVIKAKEQAKGLLVGTPTPEAPVIEMAETQENFPAGNGAQACDESGEAGEGI